MGFFTFEPNKTALLIVDMQEKLFPMIDRGDEILKAICKVLKGFRLLNLPVFVSEQYPQGLGETVEPIKRENFHPIVKTTFACNAILSEPYSQWVVVGIEAHVCILQTVIGLLKAGKEVAVLNDAISSRSIFDYSTAIAEMRDAGARITSSETLLFELLKDAKHPQFKAISGLIKNQSV